MFVGDNHFRRHVEDDEEIIMVVHKHWLLGVKYMIMPITAFICMWLLFVVAPVKFVFYLSALASIASLVWSLRNFYDYYLDAWIITDQGIIDVAWHGWFHRQSTRVLFSDIQGVSYEIQGVLGTIMRFGTIAVEKISTGGVVALENVKNPRAIEAIILKHMEGYLHTKNMTDAKHVQDILAQIIAREVNLEQFAGEEDDDDDEYEDDDYEDEDDEEDYDDDDDEDER